MSGSHDRGRRDREATRYLDALDAGDLEALALFWDRAASDPELEGILRELSEDLHAVEGSGTDFATDAARVRELALRHFPAASPPEDPAGPPTSADVARRLQSEADLGGRLDLEDRRANAVMLTKEEPLPEPLRLARLEQWGETLGVKASPRYWFAFHKVAVMLDMARCQQEGRLAAARRADPKAGRKGGAS
jgi:hypothetical protein